MEEKRLRAIFKGGKLDLKAYKEACKELEILHEDVHTFFNQYMEEKSVAGYQQILLKQLSTRDAAMIWVTGEVKEELTADNLFGMLLDQVALGSFFKMKPMCRVFKKILRKLEKGCSARDISHVNIKNNQPMRKGYRRLNSNMSCDQSTYLG